MASENLIPNTINMNYNYTTLMTAFVKDKSILRNGISNAHPIVQSINHSGWNDFNNDEKRFILFFNFKLRDYIIAKPNNIENCQVINQGALQHNYQCPLMKTVEGSSAQVPILLGDVINNPLSRTIYSNQSGENGISQHDYALQIRTALGQMIGFCPIDVRLLNYNHPFYYEVTFNLLTSTGQLTEKKAIVGIIKYKIASGEDYVVHTGTGISEFIV